MRQPLCIVIQARLGLNRHEARDKYTATEVFRVAVPDKGRYLQAERILSDHSQVALLCLVWLLQGKLLRIFVGQLSTIGPVSHSPIVFS